jgi:hypothetical protein
MAIMETSNSLFTAECLSLLLHHEWHIYSRAGWVISKCSQVRMPIVKHHVVPKLLNCYRLLSLSLMLRPTVSRPVCLGIKHPFGAYDQIFITCVTVTVLFLWGDLSDERSGLFFVYAAGPCQRSLSRVRVPWDLRPYFTVSHLRLPFSSPPTTRRVTVEVFDPASTRVRWYRLL